MRFTIEIDEVGLAEEIRAELVRRVAGDIQERIFGDRQFDTFRSIFKKDVHEAMLGLIREHEAEVIDRAVAEAASVVARKAMPKAVERLVSGNG